MSKKIFKFDSSFIKITEMNRFSDNDIKNEPMFFNSNLEFVRENCGPITHDFLDKAIIFNDTERLKSAIFDSRSHMLMKGFYPAIPGWHLDSVPRTLDNGQPNHFDIPKEHAAIHVMGLVNGDIAPTNFAIGSGELEDVYPKTYYKEWHPKIEEMIESGQLKREQAGSHDIILFNINTWHCGVEAVKSGWRWFGRLSFNDSRTPANEIRKQVQVYLPNPFVGW